MYSLCMCVYFVCMWILCLFVLYILYVCTFCICDFVCYICIHALGFVLFVFFNKVPLCDCAQWGTCYADEVASDVYQFFCLVSLSFSLFLPVFVSYSLLLISFVLRTWSCVPCATLTLGSFQNYFLYCTPLFICVFIIALI